MSLSFAAIGAYQPLAAHEYRSTYKVVTPTRPSIVETANFRIYGISRLSNAQAIGQHFETLRSSLARTWFDQRRLVDWSPKCQVVVHATRTSYTRAVGQNQFATVGSSRVDTSRDSITSRRLDIRADQAGWFAAAVPHELTHLIMADEFLGRELPCWADEGMGTFDSYAIWRRVRQAGKRGDESLRETNDGHAFYPVGSGVFRAHCGHALPVRSSLTGFCNDLDSYDGGPGIVGPVCLSDRGALVAREIHLEPIPEPALWRRRPACLPALG